jgi:large subunit ribosomal protein L31
VKNDIHPEYATATVKCACGNTFQTRSTSAEIHTDVCAECHPFYTGKQRFMDTAGRIERFRQKFAKPAATAAAAAAAAAPAASTES